MSSPTKQQRQVAQALAKLAVCERYIKDARTVLSAVRKEKPVAKEQ